LTEGKKRNRRRWTGISLCPQGRIQWKKRRTKGENGVFSKKGEREFCRGENGKTGEKR